MNRRIPKAIEQALDDGGLRWDVEPGHGHRKLRVEGRLTAVLPVSGKGKEGSRAERNVVATIRRIARSRDD